MRRIGLAVVLTICLLAASLVTEAQPRKLFRVGFLTAYSNKADAPLFDSFRQGMRELGYEEGRNIAYQTRWAEGRLERLPSLAAELVALKLDVILAASTPAVLAAKKATQTIPIVLTSVGDPVGTGLVDSLARPGGNITGNTTIIGEMAGKRLELLKQLVPQLSRVAALGFPSDPIFAVQMRHVEAVARSLKVDVFPVEIRAVSELDHAFETIVRQRADGVLRLGDPLVIPGRQRTSELARKHRLPTMANRVEEVEAGLLMSYGPNRAEQSRQAATFVDKILRGTKPADLPVEQPTKFELVINLKTAKALNLTIPQSLLLRADQVIE
jgi:putative tryptophan/tyrosine transport system substrate-binding protein